MPKNVTFLSVSVSCFPTAGLLENTQRYEIHFILLPVYIVPMAVKAVCKYCGTVLYVTEILTLSIFVYMSGLKFLNLGVISYPKFQLLYVVILTRKAAIFQMKNRHSCLY
jgi:hypothetical protein